jgi:hypothetical protein
VLIGSEEHSIEKEMEQIVNTNKLEYLLYFLYIFHGDETQYLVINVFILCQTHNNCAVDYIKQLFNFYQNQTDLFYEFDSFFVDTFIKRTLTCYDYKSQKSMECIPAEYPRCIAHNTKIFQHGCYSDPYRYIEYAFMIKPNVSSVEKVHQLIVCGSNNCNNKSVVKNIENLIYNQTYARVFLINKSNRINQNLIGIFKYFLMIFYMIF